MINMYRNVTGLILSLAIGCCGCTTNCERQIVIYQGIYFQKGQMFELSIDDEILASEKFEEQFHRNDLKKLKTYCCMNDSCKVKFVLGDSDTVFYISPLKTKRLQAGSDIYGKFSVATDEDKRAWIKL
jgi:hypothetical protein